MVGPHAAAKGKTLIDGIIPDKEVILHGLGGVIVAGVVCKSW